MQVLVCPMGLANHNGLKINQKCLISSFLKDQKLHNFPTSEKDVTEDIFFRCRKVTNTRELKALQKCRTKY